jgi:hypothetical protein
MATRFEPDWTTLEAIGDEVTALRDAGQWTKAEFDRLWAKAVDAVGEHTEFLEALVVDAEPGWLDEPGPAA